MVLIFHSIADLWRTRLEELDRRMATGSYEGWRLALERRVLTFLLRRHADAEYSAEPRQAKPLDRASAMRSSRLFISNETRRYMGLPRQLKAIVCDPRPDGEREPSGMPLGTPAEQEDFGVSFKQAYESRRTPYPLEEDAGTPSMEEEAASLGRFFILLFLLILLAIFLCS
ncbi:MAG: hypothetical protein HY291_08560 [Planctomycetes bacterium]|nr:hypothetical protein [Planctomycetota bacterium]